MDSLFLTPHGAGVRDGVDDVRVAMDRQYREQAWRSAKGLKRQQRNRNNIRGLAPAIPLRDVLTAPLRTRLSKPLMRERSRSGRPTTQHEWNEQKKTHKKYLKKVADSL